MQKSIRKKNYASELYTLMTRHETKQNKTKHGKSYSSSQQYAIRYFDSMKCFCYAFLSRNTEAFVNKKKMKKIKRKKVPGVSAATDFPTH
jgi:hypothetical protein